MEEEAFNEGGDMKKLWQRIKCWWMGRVESIKMTRRKLRDWWNDGGTPGASNGI